MTMKKDFYSILTASFYNRNAVITLPDGCKSGGYRGVQWPKVVAEQFSAAIDGLSEYYEGLTNKIREHAKSFHNPVADEVHRSGRGIRVYSGTSPVYDESSVKEKWNILADKLLPRRAAALAEIIIEHADRKRIDKTLKTQWDKAVDDMKVSLADSIERLSQMNQEYTQQVQHVVASVLDNSKTSTRSL
jgi:hypothetical protein